MKRIIASLIVLFAMCALWIFMPKVTNYLLAVLILGCTNLVIGTCGVDEGKDKR